MSTRRGLADDGVSRLALVAPQAGELIVVENFFEELKAKARN